MIIGIDPDVDKSGFAVLDNGDFRLDVAGFFEVCETLPTLHVIEKCKVYIEAGWLNKKSNYHAHKNQKKIVGERIAAKVGATHQIGKLFAEFCEKNNIPFELVRPKSKKVMPDFFKKLTGIDVSEFGKHKQEVIDAGMLIFGRNG